MIHAVVTNKLGFLVAVTGSSSLTIIGWDFGLGITQAENLLISKIDCDLSNKSFGTPGVVNSF